ncbi:hypothetical protein PENANT_c033G10937 [Penicillium antarcticum]|uniref:Uncharacterized protein n=1 Tax=Penicillium antarcticum TaxID=416450 RepID=A0A1V6PUQ3_9EURO|nr:hypothetical protein PENANT_c033G10937 [Penicillium antarcticum]
MAPNLAKSEAAGRSKRAVTRIRSNLHMFGSIKAPIKAKWPRIITPLMLEALSDRLLEKPALSFVS